MEQSLLTVLPVVGIALLGLACVKTGYLAQGAADAIARFAYAVILPLMIFRTMTQEGWPTRWDNGVEAIAAYFIAAALALVAGILLARLVFRSSAAEQRAIGIGGSHGNVALMGLPAVVMILGANLGQPILLIVGLHGLVMAPVVIAVAALFAGRTNDLPKLLGTALRNQIRNPLLIALAAGLLANRLGLRLPEAADAIIRGLAAAAVPVALFGAGAVLARYRFGGALGKPAAIAAVKLVLHPAVAWLLAAKLFSLPGSWIWVVTMLAAMPTTMGADLPGDKPATGEAGTAVLLGAVLSVASLAVLVYIIRM